MATDFDIVICVGPNDNSIVNSSVECAKKNIIGYRNIYLVCSNPSINIDGTITIDEKIFPFKMTDIENIFGSTNRNGWYLQQLLKFYSGIIIPDILQKYLIIDCDTHFLKPTKFFTDDEKQMLTTGTEYHEPYFYHMNLLHPSLKKIHPLSGISHHTFFDTECILQLFKLVEDYHNNNEPFWKIYLNVIDRTHYLGSAAAENETYFTYMYLYHNEKICIRQLNWDNVSSLDVNSPCDFVSVHWYLR